MLGDINNSVWIPRIVVDDGQSVREGGREGVVTQSVILHSPVKLARFSTKLSRKKKIGKIRIYILTKFLNLIYVTRNKCHIN